MCALNSFGIAEECIEHFTSARMCTISFRDELQML